MSELAERRRNLGWSQDHLAAEAGVSPRTVWSAEHGRHIAARSMSAIERALDAGESPGRDGASAPVLGDVPAGKVVLELSTPDGTLRLAAAVDVGTRVDVEDVRRRLLELQQHLSGAGNAGG
jgi:transcriptional regulator with XRE-family HTH domain